MLDRRVVFLLAVITPVLNGVLDAVPLSVDYVQTSWVDVGAPIAISTGPNASPAGSGQDLDNLRIPAQSFTTTNAFTLGKIWIKYDNVIVADDSFTIEVQLYEMDAPNGPTLELSSTNLFSQPQVHAVPASIPNNFLGNYAIFDVEDIALEANKGYVFLFRTTDTGNNQLAYRWMNFSNNQHSGGTFYRGDRPLATQKFSFDQIFALEIAVPTANAAIPEPGTLTLAGLGLTALLRRADRRTRCG